jgi:hypothetical protein
MESEGEFMKTAKFSCHLEDSAGGITGEYYKNNKQLKHLVVAVSGQDVHCSKAVLVAIIMSAKSDVAATKRILDKLTPGIRDFKNTTIEEGGKQYSIIVIPGVAGCMFSINDAHAANEPPNDPSNPYLEPSFGVTFNTFKSAYNKRVEKLDRSVKITAPDKDVLTSNGAIFEFTSKTIKPATDLYIDLGPNKQVTHIDVEGNLKEARHFWACVESSIGAINPRMNNSVVQVALKRLGRRNNIELPKGQADFAYRGIMYGYSPPTKDSPGCALDMRPDRP